MTMRFGLMLLMMGALLVPTMGCDKVEEVFNDEASPLLEDDLPNCSRIVTCCQKLENLDLAPEQCESIFVPAATTVIETYQDSREAISADADAVNTLRTETQDNVEPGCRCFLSETIEQINNGLVADCSVDTSVGALDDGALCSDATDALIDAAGDN